MAYITPSPSKAFLIDLLGGPYGTFESFVEFTGVQSYRWDSERDLEWEIDETTLYLTYESYGVVLRSDTTLSTRRVEITFKMGGYVRGTSHHFSQKETGYNRFRESFIEVTSLDPYPFQTF